MLREVATNATPQTVWDRLSSNESMFILDVRNRDEFERWRVEGPDPVPMFNIPYFELLDLEGEEENVTEAVIRGVQSRLVKKLPTDRPILAVCAEGSTSSYVAEGLRLYPGKPAGIPSLLRRDQARQRGAGNSRRAQVAGVGTGQEYLCRQQIERLRSSAKIQSLINGF